MRTSARCETPPTARPAVHATAGRRENRTQLHRGETHMTNQYFLDRIAGRNPNLRAGDADRERIADRLRKSHAEGRLDLAEFQERLEGCYEAKTVREDDELMRELHLPNEQAGPRAM